MVFCPECAAGKLKNCVDIALDPITDDFVTCNTQIQGEPQNDQ